MKKFNVAYKNGRGVFCSQKVEAKSVHDAIE